MANESPSPQNDENRLIAERRAKLAARREQAAARGESAFPNDFRRDSHAAELIAELGDKEKDELEALNRQAGVAGRIMRKRGPFIVLRGGALVGHFATCWKSLIRKLGHACRYSRASLVGGRLCRAKGGRRPPRFAVPDG